MKTSVPATTMIVLCAVAGARPALALDACALVSKAEIEAIAGRPMAKGAPPPAVPPTSADVTFTQCSWPTPDGDDPIGLAVRISKKGDSAPGYARQTAIDSGFKVEDVSGLGDLAFWNGIQLQVFRGKDLQIVVNVMGHRDGKDKAIQVARKALARL
jgi:hypothetical protein